MHLPCQVTISDNIINHSIIQCVIICYCDDSSDRRHRDYIDKVLQQSQLLSDIYNYIQNIYYANLLNDNECHNIISCISKDQEATD